MKSLVPSPSVLFLLLAFPNAQVWWDMKKALLGILLLALPNSLLAATIPQPPLPLDLSESTFVDSLDIYASRVLYPPSVLKLFTSAPNARNTAISEFALGILDDSQLHSPSLQIRVFNDLAALVDNSKNTSGLGIAQVLNGPYIEREAAIALLKDAAKFRVLNQLPESPETTQANMHNEFLAFRRIGATGTQACALTAGMLYSRSPGEPAPFTPADLVNTMQQLARTGLGRGDAITIATDIILNKRYTAEEFIEARSLARRMGLKGQESENFYQAVLIERTARTSDLAAAFESARNIGFAQKDAKVLTDRASRNEIAMENLDRAYRIFHADMGFGPERARLLAEEFSSEGNNAEACLEAVNRIKNETKIGNSDARKELALLICRGKIDHETFLATYDSYDQSLSTDLSGDQVALFALADMRAKNKQDALFMASSCLSRDIGRAWQEMLADIGD